MESEAMLSQLALGVAGNRRGEMVFDAQQLYIFYMCFAKPRAHRNSYRSHKHRIRSSRMGQAKNPIMLRMFGGFGASSEGPK